MPLRLPDQFAGPWDHLLLLSYGLDAVFFERMLLTQLPARCRDRIILTDGRQYVRASERYAEAAVRRPPGQTRYLNRSYVAEGIFTAHAAHAKLILLANAERGRLLVGSGNLGWSYVSGAELFTQYEYTAAAPDTLPAFLAARAFVEGILDRSYVSSVAEDRIRRMFGQLPWLYTAAEREGTPPIIHNLQQSMLSQLVETVGGEFVDELWLHAPFFDHDVIAFQRLLEALRPRRAHLLVQPGLTSVDARMLIRALTAIGSDCEVHRFSSDAGAHTLTHAKFYLLKLGQKAICLHGSPNLSQVALLLNDPHGNVELANLQSGPRDAFDDVLHALKIEPPDTEGLLREPDAWNLRYDTGEDDADTEQWAVTLRSGELRDSQLRLVATHPFSSLSDMVLVIGQEEFTLHVENDLGSVLEVRLDPDAVKLLDRQAPLHVSWGNGVDRRKSNSIFVCHIRALEETLQEQTHSETLAHVGDLEIDDDEIEQLFGALNETMVVDMPSVWQLAGKKSHEIVEDDQGPRLSYDDIDYALLRQHPRIQPYLYGFGAHSGDARSRLQQMLNAITSHFQGMTDSIAEYALEQAQFAALAESYAQSEDEVGLADDAIESSATDGAKQVPEQREQAHLARQQRIRRLLLQFTQRFIKGLGSRRFQEFAGVEIMTRNYEIFAHLLVRMLDKDWIEHELVLRHLLTTWRLFWGDGQQSGYLEKLNDEQLRQVHEELRRTHADAEVIAALYLGAELTAGRSGAEITMPLRDQLRAIMAEPPFAFTTALMEDVWLIVADLFHATSAPSCEEIVTRLASLARIETPTSLLRTLERAMRIPNGSLQFRSQKVQRRDAHGDSASATVMALCAQKAVIANDYDALELICFWMGRQQLDYYRLMLDDTSWGFYDVRQSAGKYSCLDTPGKSGTIGRTPPTLAAWDAQLQQLQRLAQQVDEELAQRRSVVSVEDVQDVALVDTIKSIES